MRHKIRCAVERRPGRRSAANALSLMHSLAHEEVDGPTDSSGSGSDGRCSDGGSDDVCERVCERAGDRDRDGPWEETEVTAPDGSVIKCVYRGVDPGLTPGSKEWRKAKRLADNRASAARSRALARVRTCDMTSRVEELAQDNRALRAENERLRAMIEALGGSVPRTSTTSTPGASECESTHTHIQTRAKPPVGRGRVARVARGSRDAASSQPVGEQLKPAPSGASLHEPDSDVHMCEDTHAGARSGGAKAGSNMAALSALLPLDDAEMEPQSSMDRDIESMMELSLPFNPSGNASPSSDSTASFRDPTQPAAELLPAPSGDVLREYSMASVLSPMHVPAVPAVVPAMRLTSLTLDCMSPMAAMHSVASPAFSFLSGAMWAPSAQDTMTDTATGKRRAGSAPEVEPDSFFAEEQANQAMVARKRARSPIVSMLTLCLAVAVAVHTSPGESGSHVSAINAGTQRRLCGVDHDAADAPVDVPTTFDTLNFSTASAPSTVSSDWFVPSWSILFSRAVQTVLLVLGAWVVLDHVVSVEWHHDSTWRFLRDKWRGVRVRARALLPTYGRMHNYKHL